MKSRTVRRAPRRLAAMVVRARRRLPAADQVALTFDDGPDPEFTPLVLDILRRYSVPATFFLVGRRVTDNPSLVDAIRADGHAVGSHSYIHPDPWTLGWRELGRDYRRGRAVLESVTGGPAPLFRPPKGMVGWSGAAAMLAARVSPWLWTIDTKDWRPNVEADEIERRSAAASGGDVLLLHDGLEGPTAQPAADRSATVAALPKVITCLRQRGLAFVPLAHGRAGRPGGRR